MSGFLPESVIAYVSEWTRWYALMTVSESGWTVTEYGSGWGSAWL